MALQHQRHHVVLTRKNLTELLSQAGCFLWTPVYGQSSKLPVLVTCVPSSSMSSTFTPTLSTCRIQRSTQRSVAEVQDLSLGAGRFGGREIGGYAGKRVVSWVRSPEGK